VTRPGGSPADALLDRAIEALLEDRPGPVPAETAELLATARLLRDRLPRYHPRFRFEEHLAARLAAVGGPAGDTPAADAGAPTPRAAAIVLLPVVDGARSVAPPARRRRSLLAGGAIASGVSLAIPIAGAALVAWRRGRAGGSL
jgi:hypothetical protein